MLMWLHLLICIAMTAFGLNVFNVFYFILDTIHRSNQDFYEPPCTEERLSCRKTREKERVCDDQKTLDLAREKKFDACELMKYDLTQSMYLFDVDEYNYG